MALAVELERAGIDDTFEIIEGELVAHASPTNPHMRAAAACLKLLLDAEWAGYGVAGFDRQEPGVRIYWLVDTQRRTATTYERRGDKPIETAVLRPGDTLRNPLFPELGVPVERLFAAP